MIKNKKKGLIGYVLVVLIGFLVIAWVMFSLQDGILTLLRGSSEDQTCVWSTILQSSSKRIAAGNPLYDFNCPMKFVNIGLKDDKKEDIIGIDEKLSSRKIKKLAEQSDNYYTENYFKDENKLREYRLNEIMANEMRSCWNKMGRGELDLFSDWFLEREGKPVNVCVICSRISFSAEIENFKTGQDDSFELWLAKHPVNLRSPNPISYFEFLTDDKITKFEQNPETGDSDFFKSYPYTTDKPYAVLFMRLNGFAVSNFINLALSEIGLAEEFVPVSKIALLPFSDIDVPCTRLVN